MMKKILPIFIFGLSLTLAVSFQIVWDKLDLGASLPPIKSEKYDYFNKLYKDEDFITLNGKTLKLPELNSKIVILNFWASWCLPCLKELPSLVELNNNYTQKDLSIISINTDDTDYKKKIDKVKIKYNLNFPIVSDPNGTLAEKFYVNALPFTLIFKEGKVIEHSFEAKDFMSKKFLTKIKSHLKL